MSRKIQTYSNEPLSLFIIEERCESFQLRARETEKFKSPTRNEVLDLRLPRFDALTSGYRELWDKLRHYLVLCDTRPASCLQKRL